MYNKIYCDSENLIKSKQTDEQPNRLDRFNAQHKNNSLEVFFKITATIKRVACSCLPEDFI